VRGTDGLGEKSLKKLLARKTEYKAFVRQILRPRYY